MFEIKVKMRFVFLLIFLVEVVLGQDSCGTILPSVESISPGLNLINILKADFWNSIVFGRFFVLTVYSF